MKIKMTTKIDFNQIWNEATWAAQEAADNSGIPTDSYPCGFAWIKVPNRGKFAKFLLENNIARKSHDSGLTIWYTKVYNYRGSQNMDRHLEAVEAASDVLRKYGIVAESDSIFD